MPSCAELHEGPSCSARGAVASRSKSPPSGDEREALRLRHGHVRLPLVPLVPPDEPPTDPIPPAREEMRSAGGASNASSVEFRRNFLAETAVAAAEARSAAALAKAAAARNLKVNRYTHVGEGGVLPLLYDGLWTGHVDMSDFIGQLHQAPPNAACSGASADELVFAKEQSAEFASAFGYGFGPHSRSDGRDHHHRGHLDSSQPSFSESGAVHTPSPPCPALSDGGMREGLPSCAGAPVEGTAECPGIHSDDAAPGAQPAATTAAVSLTGAASGAAARFESGGSAGPNGGNEVDSSGSAERGDVLTKPKLGIRLPEYLDRPVESLLSSAPPMTHPPAFGRLDGRRLPLPSHRGRAPTTGPPRLEQRHARRRDTSPPLVRPMPLRRPTATAHVLSSLIHPSIPTTPSFAPSSGPAMPPGGATSRHLRHDVPPVSSGDAHGRVKLPTAPMLPSPPLPASPLSPSGASPYQLLALPWRTAVGEDGAEASSWQGSPVGETAFGATASASPRPSPPLCSPRHSPRRSPRHSPPPRCGAARGIATSTSPPVGKVVRAGERDDGERGVSTAQLPWSVPVVKSAPAHVEPLVWYEPLQWGGGGGALDGGCSPPPRTAVSCPNSSRLDAGPSTRAIPSERKLQRLAQLDHEAVRLQHSCTANLDDDSQAGTADPASCSPHLPAAHRSFRSANGSRRRSPTKLDVQDAARCAGHVQHVTSTGHLYPSYVASPSSQLEQHLSRTARKSPAAQLAANALEVRRSIAHLASRWATDGQGP